MERITLTKDNLATSVTRQAPAYYIIEGQVNVRTKTTFPKGSVLDFRGGIFVSANMDYTVDLNGSTVYAPAYGIFDKALNIINFGNSYIRAEWFKLGTGISEHVAINRSLVAANGIPVHLESRTYQLTGSIKFPDGPSNQTLNQTLVSPGVLQISEDIEAIVVDTTFVNLNINKIEYTGANGRGGTGIKLTGNAYYLDIRVNILENLERAFAVIPDLGSTSLPWSGIQYCTIRFKEILNAEYGFYVDLFNNGASTPSNEVPAGKWFSEARVIGGRMSGVNGIYFLRPYTKSTPKPEGQDQDQNNEDPYFSKYAASMNGLLFEDITFEEISGTPLFISHISSSKFLNLRFGKGLPEAKNRGWIYLNYVSYLIISVQEPLDPMRILLDDAVKSVIFDAYIIDSFDNNGHPVCQFDRLSIKPLTVKTIEDGEVTYVHPPQMTATSSIQPFNMAVKTIKAVETPSFGWASKHYSLNDLLPINKKIEISETGEEKKSIFNVLPRTLNLIIKEDNEVVIDLSGLGNFYPCMIDVFGMIEPGGKLTFETKDLPSAIKILENGYERTVTSVSFNELGLYRLTFDSDWYIVISKVTL